MPERIRRLTAHARQHAVAYLALFLALGGGSAYAANTIGSADVIDGSLLSIDLKDGEVKSSDLANDAVRTNKIAAANVTTSDLAADAVNSAKVASNTLTGADVDESQLDAAQLRARVAAGDCGGSNPDDVMVNVGPFCVDRYEASIWDAPTGGNQITGPIPCNRDGQNCTNIYARSVPGVEPRADISWFQAQQALANSGKRLPTNAEWQMAVAGTPDGGSCNVSSGGLQRTGESAGCVSNYGTNDMVGNLWEWVADWLPSQRQSCGRWPDLSDDMQCLGYGTSTSNGPTAPQRGGGHATGALAGPFAINSEWPVSHGLRYIGFRGAR
jgi:hypothetical protein